ncbi:uncharacterized protein LOC108003283 [Apis cerana]|uniref:Uncharacterized protein LOC100577488 n=2 Tax=Apis TaxID=7459 RepID=A0A7M7GQS9_APIME|nr:uncharacterized protein LOC100577488 [Apis mellifera]XP_016920939.2 uncharacterized protein LOC108003283 [Apis cerana]|eukprot:XP_006559528.1 uncharacterized protein LOC100577488 [Apis mellifera]
MYRLGYIAMFAGLTVMAQDCYDVCKKCNRSSQELKPVDIIHLYPQLHFPLIQDTPYLLEEDFIKNKQNHQRSLNRNNRNLLPEYHSLCETITKKVQLDDSEYEYQPPYYHEIYCKSYNLLDNLRRAVNLSKQKCVHSGFHCVQRSKTLLLVRRRWDNECWEPFVKQIASGCDCMWPVSVLGDITDHY